MKTRILTATIAAFIVGHGSLNAANFTWDGGALFSVNDWGAGLNWSTNIAPPSDGTADLFFAGSTRLNANADAAWNIKSLTFNAGAGHFEIQGSALTIGSGGVTNSGGSEQDISNNIVLSAPQTFNTTAPGGLDLNGAVNNAGNLLTVDAGAGLIRFFGNVNGAGGLTKTGAGTVRLEGVASNIFAGTTTVNEGTLELAKAGGLVAVPGALNVSGGASVVLFGNNQIGNASAVSVTGFSVVNLNGFSDQIGSLSIVSGTVQTGAGTLFLGGNVTAPVVNDAVISGAVDLMGALRTLDVGNNVVLERDLSITATIANGAILKTGAGSLLLAGANTFAGGVTVSAGELNVGGNSAVGTGTLTLNTGGAIRSDKSAVMLANAVTITGDADFTGIRDLTFSGATTLSGSRTLNVTNSAQTIFSGSFGSDTLFGSITKTGAGLLTVTGPIDALSSSNSALINGHLSLGGGVRTITVANGSGDFDLSISASIIDGSITKAGGGLLAITGPQSYSALLAQAGTTKLFTTLGSGTSTVNVTPTGACATVNFNACQTLASLTIGSGGVVNLDNEPVPAPPLPLEELVGSPMQAVPEPGSAMLALFGAATLGFRRRPRTDARSIPKAVWR